VGDSTCLPISHLQFAYDTLLIVDKSWTNIRSLKAILILLEVISGLKVNFHKTRLVGVNVSASWLAETSVVLNYKARTLPFSYLGLLIDGDSWDTLTSPEFI